MSETFKPAKHTIDEKRRERVKETLADATQVFTDNGGALTENIGRFVKTYCDDHGLSTEECAFGMALLCINMRNDFPEDLGGPAKFDEVARFAQDYYTKGVK